MNDPHAQTTFSITGRRIDWLLRGLLVAAVLAVFWPILRTGFVAWDDAKNIVTNPHLGLGWQEIKWMFTDTLYVRRYMPLGWFSYAVDRAFFGGAPASYHAGNLLLHALNAVLLYSIVVQLLRRIARQASVSGGSDLLTRSKIQPKFRRFAAAAGALWWAVNPLRAEPVAWASSRIYCAATFFYFLAVLAYLRREDASLLPGQRKRAMWVAIICFGLSLFVYPIALGGLLVFVVLDFYPLRRLPLNPREWFTLPTRPVWVEKFLFGAPAMVMFVCNLWARLNHPDVQAVATFKDFSLAARMMQALWTWAWYVWKPWQPFDLAPKYPDLLTDLPFTTAHLVAALVVVGLSVLFYFRRHAWPGLFALWLCHLALLAPLAGFTEHPHYTFDRYNYLAGGLWALALAVLVLHLWRWERLQVPVTTAIISVCCYFGWLAREQTAIWGDSLSLQSRMAESLGNYPQRASHEVVIATFLLEANRPKDAAIALRRATVLQPELPEAWAAFGDALAAQNRLDDATRSYRRALALNPLLRSARQNLAVSLATAGRHAEAVKELTELLRTDPTDAASHHNIALSLNSLGRKEEAEKHLIEFRRLRQSSQQ